MQSKVRSKVQSKIKSRIGKLISGIVGLSMILTCVTPISFGDTSSYEEASGNAISNTQLEQATYKATSGGAIDVNPIPDR